MTSTDLLNELDCALELVKRHHQHTPEGAINRTILATLRGLVVLEVANYRRLERLEKAMALNTTTMDQNATEAKQAVVDLATSHGTTETQAQTIIDGAAQKFADIRDTAKAATPPPATPPAQ